MSKSSDLDNMNDYEKQAQDFLTETETKLEVVYQYTGPYFTDESANNPKTFREVYRFTLTNKRGTYSATFGGSIRDRERREFALAQGISTYYNGNPKFPRSLGFSITSAGYIKREELHKAATHKPSVYDILACLDTYTPETFEDFCSEYGYDDMPLSKYPEVMKVFQACIDQKRGLEKIFTVEQMETLSEIN